MKNLGERSVRVPNRVKGGGVGGLKYDNLCYLCLFSVQ